jgi:hypothetical protein
MAPWHRWPRPTGASAVGLRGVPWNAGRRDQLSLNSAQQELTIATNLELLDSSRAHSHNHELRPVLFHILPPTLLGDLGLKSSGIRGVSGRAGAPQGSAARLQGSRGPSRSRRTSKPPESRQGRLAALGRKTTGLSWGLGRPSWDIVVSYHDAGP